MDITPFLPLITGAIGGATSAGVFKGPVQTLQDWWYVHYGYEMSDKAAILKARQEANVQKLQQSLLKNVSEIKPENIQEPKLNILGPALEASRFYIEEQELRDMFAKVIASSMDKEKNNQMHPAFVEIIKQLSPDDALFLKEFENTSRLPYGKLIFIEEMKTEFDTNINNLNNKNRFPMLPKLPTMEEFMKSAPKSYPFIDYFYYSTNRNDIQKNKLNISSLSRLGLIEVKENTPLTNSSLYEDVEKKYSTLKQDIEKGNSDVIPPDGFNLEFTKGVIDLTTFGSAFFVTCCI